MVFAAKVDFWFLGLFYGLGLFMLVGAPFLRARRRGLGASILLVVLGLLFIGIGWRASEVEYVLTKDGYLDATGWPLEGRITHVTEIQSVAPSNDPRASHAASLDRLRIDFGNGGLIFIAVENEAGFLDALAASDAELVRSDGGIVRDSSSR